MGPMWENRQVCIWDPNGISLMGFSTGLWVDSTHEIQHEKNLFYASPVRHSVLLHYIWMSSDVCHGYLCVCVHMLFQH